MRIKLVYHRIPHHAKHSGYDQLGRYLAHKVPVEHLDGFLPDSVPPERWRPILEQTGMEWYDVWSLGLEHSVALDLCQSQRTIYHLLYGENSFHYLGALRWLADIQDSRLVCTYHQPPAVFEEVVRSKAAISALDAIIALSREQADYFASLVGPERVHLIPHGIDTDSYRPVQKVPSKTLTCLCVGRWLRDFDQLRKVSQEVAEVNSAVRFHIVAGPDDAGSFRGLENVTVVSNLSDVELLQAYQNADLLVLPLTDCTANNALLEAMACGLPIVTTAVGGAEEYVDRKCARLVPRGDARAMRDHILALAADRSLRIEMGRASRRRALDFDWSSVAERMLMVYSGMEA